MILYFIYTEHTRNFFCWLSAAELHRQGQIFVCLIFHFERHTHVYRQNTNLYIQMCHTETIAQAQSYTHTHRHMERQSERESEREREIHVYMQIVATFYFFLAIVPSDLPVKKIWFAFSIIILINKLMWKRSMLFECHCCRYLLCQTQIRQIKLWSRPAV